LSKKEHGVVKENFGFRVGTETGFFEDQGDNDKKSLGGFKGTVHDIRGGESGVGDGG
jgi:hypothetical protein